MTLIKERAGLFCVIREDNYSESLGKVMRMYEEAKRDFPCLDYDMVRVVKFGGDRYKRTIGIEFDIPVHMGDIPPCYKDIGKLEPLL